MATTRVSRERDLDLDVDVTFHAQGAEHRREGADAEIRLLQADSRHAPSVLRPRGEGDRLLDAVERQPSFDGVAIGCAPDRRRLEGDRRKAVRLQRKRPRSACPASNPAPLAISAPASQFTRSLQSHFGTNA